MRQYTLCAFLIMLLFTACEKELDFKYKEISPLPVIEGVLTPRGIMVSVTQTTPMAEPMDTTRLTDAQIILTDLSEETFFPLTPDNTGFYSGAPGGIPGHKYRLSIDRNGAHYEAETLMYPPVEILSLEFNWIKMPYDYVAVLKGTFSDDPHSDDDCYWIKIYRNGKIYKWMELDDRSAEDGVKSFVVMTTRRDTEEEDDDEVLFDGDVMTCSVCRISRSMHDYLEALQNDSNGPAMFGADFCLGYFMATSPVASSIVFHPESIPDYSTQSRAALPDPIDLNAAAPHDALLQRPSAGD